MEHVIYMTRRKTKLFDGYLFTAIQTPREKYWVSHTHTSLESECPFFQTIEMIRRCYGKWSHRVVCQHNGQILTGFVEISVFYRSFSPFYCALGTLVWQAEEVAACPRVSGICYLSLVCSGRVLLEIFHAALSLGTGERSELEQVTLKEATEAQVWDWERHIYYYMYSNILLTVT